MRGRHNFDIIIVSSTTTVIEHVKRFHFSSLSLVFFVVGDNQLMKLLIITIGFPSNKLTYDDDDHLNMTFSANNKKEKQ